MFHVHFPTILSIQTKFLLLHLPKKHTLCKCTLLYYIQTVLLYINIIVTIIDVFTIYFEHYLSDYNYIFISIFFRLSLLQPLILIYYYVIILFHHQLALVFQINLF